MEMLSRWPQVTSSIIRTVGNRPSLALSPPQEDRGITTSIPIGRGDLWWDCILFSISRRRVYEMEARGTGFMQGGGAKVLPFDNKAFVFLGCPPPALTPPPGPGGKGHHHVILSQNLHWEM